MREKKKFNIIIKRRASGWHGLELGVGSEKEKSIVRKMRSWFSQARPNVPNK